MAAPMATQEPAQESTPEPTQELDKFIRCLSRFNDYSSSAASGPFHYPFNVLHKEDRKRLLEAYFRHHKKVRTKILLQLDLLSLPQSSITDPKTRGRYDLQRTRAQRLINVPIHDYDSHANEPESYAINFKRLIEMLGKLHWPVPVSLERIAEYLAQGPPKSQPNLSNGVAPSPADGVRMRLPQTYKKDPKCRFVLLETASSETHRLDISEDFLFLILSYHQVSPAYLNFITCFSSQTGSSDLRFGGFRCQTAFTTDTKRAIPQLGRSGLHFQLSFKLRTILEREPDARDRLGKASGWSKPQAAIYHHFDVEEAKALWIITAPRRSFPGNIDRNVLWDQIRGSISANKPVGENTVRVSSDSHEKRLAGALDVLVTIGEWSLSDFAFYLQDIEEVLDKLTDPYLEDGNPPEVKEWTLQRINHWIQELNHCIIKLEGNVHVLKSLIDVYRALGEKTKHLNQCAWVAGCADNITIFGSQMTNMIGETVEIQARAKALKQLATNREDFIQRLLQNRQTKYINSLTKISSDEATLMRVFQTITLVLLPMTVVSTVFSTDILKYHVVGPDSPWKAVVILVSSMVGLCLVVWFWFRWLKQHAEKRLRGKREDAMKEGDGMPPKSEDVSDGEDGRIDAEEVFMRGAVPTPIEGVPVSRVRSHLSKFSTRKSGKRSAQRSSVDGVYEMENRR